jgi:hypothetical protein
VAALVNGIVEKAEQFPVIKTKNTMISKQHPSSGEEA